MIVVTYTTPKGKTLRGIMIRRDVESGLIEVAFDQTDTKQFSIGWIHPIKQVKWVDLDHPEKELTSKVSLQSNLPVRWRHRALRLIESKNILEARIVFAQEEDARKQERIRKERAA